MLTVQKSIKTGRVLLKSRSKLRRPNIDVLKNMLNIRATKQLLAEAEISKAEIIAEILIIFFSAL